MVGKIMEVVIVWDVFWALGGKVSRFDVLKYFKGKDSSWKQDEDKIITDYWSR